jgi:hypothetical protein
VEPISSYQGTWLEGSYRFDLLPDSLRVTGSTFLHSDVDAAIPLSTLQVRSDRIRARSGMFGIGILVTIIAVIAHSIAITGLKLDPVGLSAGLLMTTAVAGIGMALAGVRKTEFARLVTDAGVGAVNIPRTRAGDGFDDFVHKVLSQIRACKGLEQAPDPADPPTGITDKSSRSPKQ